MKKEPKGEDNSIRIEQFLMSEQHKDDAQAACASFCKALQRELNEAEEYIAHVEGMKTVFQF